MCDHLCLQALFTPDGNYLFTGARKENDILCWDIRNTSRVVMRLSRLVDTNQHIRFDIDPTGKYLITASQVPDDQAGLFVLKMVCSYVIAVAQRACRTLEPTCTTSRQAASCRSCSDTLVRTTSSSLPIRCR